MRIRPMIAAGVAAFILVAWPQPTLAEPGRGPEIDIGPITYESDADLDAAEEAAREAAGFDPTVISEFDLVGRRGLVVRNLALRQLALNDAADKLNEATAEHLEAKQERRGAATGLEEMRDTLRTFSVDAFRNGASLEIDRLSADNTLNRQAYSVDSLGEELMGQVTLASNELLRLIEVEADEEELRAFFRSELLVRVGDQAIAIEILREFEAAVLAREAAIKARIEASLAASSDDGFELWVVGDITVAAEIVESVELMLEAALSDGIELQGWGYRSHASQIDLRRAHCGGSEYAIFDMPASHCSPPTATPGHSQHEIGLAIDFTQNGSTLTHSSTAFVWLEQHAEEFGFFNLPSEAWHWSTTGH